MTEPKKHQDLEWTERPDPNPRYYAHPTARSSDDGKGVVWEGDEAWNPEVHEDYPKYTPAPAVPTVDVHNLPDAPLAQAPRPTPAVVNSVADRAKKTAQGVTGKYEAAERAVANWGERHAMSDDTKFKVDAAIANAKNRAEQFARPKNMWMRQNIPGADAVGRSLDNDNSWAPEPIRRAADLGTYAKDPGLSQDEMDYAPTREPVQMQREFSNDQEKDAYVKRLREAAKKAAGGAGLDPDQMKKMRQ